MCCILKNTPIVDVILALYISKSLVVVGPSPVRALIKLHMEHTHKVLSCVMNNTILCSESTSVIVKNAGHFW
jgi:hypothetical protein